MGLAQSWGPKISLLLDEGPVNPSQVGRPDPCRPDVKRASPSVSIDLTVIALLRIAAMGSMNLSASLHPRVLKLARTIVDLAEALQHATRALA